MLMSVLENMLVSCWKMGYFCTKTSRSLTRTAGGDGEDEHQGERGIYQKSTLDGMKVIMRRAAVLFRIGSPDRLSEAGCGEARIGASGADRGLTRQGAVVGK
jgi:hypothetical protein